ncbi:uncharacterized protein RAG0_16576 [Rhynchosporium agropyri]|uniref:2EXR domain-containing protein n=1 Tax=Rhynchosporium agropyri TaxID=914238 RepID=A0A1E1LR00_9HELO|nr:uncharacterized protein RAG0_16576 [Rhynchosporium agropyri]
MEQKFPRFSDLPVEIRLLIWEETIEPKIVHLRQQHISECYHAVESVSSNRHVDDRCCGKISGHYHGRKKEFHRMDRIRGRPWNHYAMGFNTDRPIPPLFLACQESYQVASKVYTRSFSALGSIAQTYFNFRSDTLYLDKRTEAPTAESIVQDVLPYMCQDELARVEKLALNSNLLTEAIGSYENYLACILYSFKNVKTVYLISEPELVEWERRMGAEAGRKRLSQDLIMYETIETAEHTNSRLCAECCLKLDLCGIAPLFPMEISEERVQLEGKSICGGRGQVWCQPTLIYNQTITTPEMKARVDELWREWRDDRECQCIDIGDDDFDVLS